MAGSRAAVAALLIVFSLAATAHAANLVGGASAAIRLQQRMIAAINLKYKSAGLLPYGISNSNGGIVGLKKGAYAVGIGNVPFSPLQEKFYPKYTLPQAIATYSLFTTNPILQQVDPVTLGRMMRGVIKTWAQVKGAIIKGPIVWAGRADLSGTTSQTTTYMRRQLGTGWPTKFVGQGPFNFGPTTKLFAGSVGVARKIRGDPYAVGFLETSFGKANLLAEIAIKNANGKFMISTGGTVYPAVIKTFYPSASFSWYRISLVNYKAPTQYPIASFIYAFTRTTLAPYGRTGGIAKAYLLYTMSKPGQALVKAAGMNPLITKLVTQNKVAIRKLALGKGVRMPFIAPL
eukprot:jgi/Mesen1/6867/ME000351S05973